MKAPTQWGLGCAENKFARMTTPEWGTEPGPLNLLLGLGLGKWLLSLRPGEAGSGLEVGTDETELRLELGWGQDLGCDGSSNPTLLLSEPLYQVCLWCFFNPVPNPFPLSPSRPPPPQPHHLLKIWSVWLLHLSGQPSLQDRRSGWRRST